jgi:hypothetical protein
MSIESTHDVRVVLVREKFFSLRPKPLERWLWQKGVAQAAERIFWLHWEEGYRNGSWCSQIPLRTVAAACCVDVSTVTRAYQHLASLGLIRRQDPGRDPSKPFQQATAVTEVRVPRELTCELNRHPNRKEGARRFSAPQTAKPTHQEANCIPAGDAPPASPHISIKARLQALSALQAKMNPTEKAAFNEALRTHSAHMSFSEDTAMSAEDRAAALEWLSRMVARPAHNTQEPQLTGSEIQGHRKDAPPRKLSVFELARARNEISRATGTSEATEVLRQVVWSMEKGALRRFAPMHALNIALKKVRRGEWSRPHRLPPNWTVQARDCALPEQCVGA